MADFWLDFSVNTVEAFAAITLMLALFRFSLKGYVFQIILSSIIIAQTSYLLRFVFHLDIITPIFMLAWIVLSLWRFMRIHPFYAYVMCVAGYLMYIVIQAVLILILQLWYSLDYLLSFPLVKYIQLGSIALTFAVSFLLTIKRIGFSFVPDRINVKISFSKFNLMLLILSIVGSFLISGFAYILLKIDLMLGAFLAVCILIIMYIVHISYKKEMSS